MSVYNEEQAIEEETIKEWPNQRLVLSLKSIGPNLYLDLRKWVPDMASKELHPSKRGIMLRFEDWDLAIPKIQAMRKRNTSANG